MYKSVCSQAKRPIIALIVMFQAEFNNSCLANLDINSLTDDIVEDIMLHSKPLQVILLAIRNRQKVNKLCKQRHMFITWNLQKIQTRVKAVA